MPWVAVFSIAGQQLPCGAHEHVLISPMKTVPVLASDEIQEDKPIPSRNHARAAHNLGVSLDRFKDRYVIYDQLSLNLDGWQTIPDLCLYRRGELADDWLTDDDEVTLPPELVIEILSPKQNLQPLVDKIREYGRHGVKSCWPAESSKSNSIFTPKRCRSDGLVKVPTA